MLRDRAVQLRRMLDDAARDDHTAATTLCAVCVDVLQVAGAGLSLVSDSHLVGTVAASDAAAAQIDELQFTLGEGPCIEALRLGGPVLEADLSAPAAARWPGFSRAATEAGFSAVFAFPLQVGAVRIGALDVFRHNPGELTPNQLTDALLLCDAATQILLDLQNQSAAGQPTLDDPTIWRAEVHQATGMIMVQLGIGIDEAFVRLRAHAYATGQRVGDVAHDVVTRRLRFDAGSDEQDRGSR